MKPYILFLFLVFAAWFASAQSAPDDNLTSFRGQNNSKMTFTTTGTLDGSVWGGADGVYTDDSRLGKAAVHAGLLQVGQTGIVTVTILSGRSSYTGSNNHGVQTQNYGAWTGSFQFSGNVQVSNTVATAPANMTNFRGNTGSVHTYQVTGTNDGSVWGGANGIYTDDSKLSTAAVHAGLLRVGETATLKVVVVKGQSSYQGSTSNGIKSNDYGAWHGSYRFESAANTNISTAPSNMTAYRGNNGQVYTFKITGANSGNVWGGANGIYTDDSALGAAAVHAGKVGVGEEAIIRVRVVGPQSSYQGSTRNGITSKDYGAWTGSYSFE